MSRSTALAQDMEARAYAPNPVGIRFGVVTWTHSNGDVLLDAASPIKDFEIRSDSTIAGIGGTFAIGDRLASLAVAVPYVDGTATGRVDGVRESVNRAGAGDARMRFAVSLLPGSALSPAEFRAHPPDRTFGVGVVLIVPTGEYYPDKLVNIGANRWAVRPEVGGSRRFGPWNVDGSVGVWLYQDNDQYLGRHERSQEPLATVQGHLSYTFAPRLWLGASGTWYAGGTTSVDGVSDRNRQGNSRAGLTLALPLGTHNSIKLAWSKGVTARFGGDTENVGVTWQVLWF